MLSVELVFVQPTFLPELTHLGLAFDVILRNSDFLYIIQFMEIKQRNNRKNICNAATIYILYVSCIMFCTGVFATLIFLKKGCQ